MQNFTNHEQRQMTPTNRNFITQQQQQQQDGSRSSHDLFVSPPIKPPNYESTNSKGKKMLASIGYKAGDEFDDADFDSDNYGENRAMEGITTIDTAAVKDLFTEEYYKDFDTFKKMNLTDSDNLDEFYSFASSLSEMPAMASAMFLMMYRAKYPNLFEKYASLESYFLFVIISITNNGFENFKRYLGSKNPTVNNFIPLRKKQLSKFAQMRNNRKRSIDESQLSDINQNNQSITSENHNTPRHPMLYTTYYNQKRILFHIGDMAKYLLPLDFSISEAQPSLSTITIYLKTNKNKEVPGAEVRFGVPVLCRLNKRNIVNYVYNFVDKAEMILEFVTKCFGTQSKHINTSIKINQNYNMLTDINRTTVLVKMNFRQNQCTRSYQCFHFIIC
ncbi:unnamed protein product [Macrosiphum euphorbiae]|uniref:Uncharacterized protein n=1 Tax=Macrosiphum euphorbiae TaxID=13131 RepID=A0AAV0XZH0_9HEMI|nr:unnamed protein product [Macrosiphum euphorbiae]